MKDSVFKDIPKVNSHGAISFEEIEDRIRDGLKQAIKDHKDLICENKFQEFFDILADFSSYNYAECGADAEIQSSLFTEMLLTSGICFLDYMTKIPDRAFSNIEGFTSFTIPNNIEILGEGSFRDSDIESIVIPDTVKKIGPRCFWYCVNLKSVKIGKGINTLKPTTFANCESLTSIVIPGNVFHIGRYCFADCTNLKDVILKNGVGSIDAEAFIGCNNLETITIPTTVKNISSSAFPRRRSITVKTEKGSTAEKYAKKYKMKIEYIN